MRKTRRSEGLVKVEMTGGRAVGCPVSAVRVPDASELKVFPRAIDRDQSF